MEGWGLYAENPLISDDTDVYDGEPMKKYGMLKWQVSEIKRIGLIVKFGISAWHVYVGLAIIISI